jgi:hypothetical protein
LVILTVIAAVSVGIVVSAETDIASGGTVFDDLETGDVSKWDGREAGDLDGFAEFEARENASLEGTYGLYAESAGDGLTYSARLDVTAAPYDNVSFYMQSVTVSSNGGGVIEMVDGGGSVFTAVNVNSSHYVEVDTGGGTRTTDITVQQNEWYRYQFEFNYTDDTFSLNVYDTDGALVGSSDWDNFDEPAGEVAAIDIYDTPDKWSAEFDYFSANGSEADIGEQVEVSGIVLDQDGQGVGGATVEVGSTSVTTDADGEYSLTVTNGTYSASATKQGYTKDEKMVSVSGATAVDFDIREQNESLRIETREFIEHDQTVPFEVLHYNESTESWENVTADPDLNVTVEDPQIVTIGNGTITATNDTTVNNETFVNANYTPTGATDSQHVVVANETIENVDILPPMQKFTASVGTPDMQVVLIATGVGAGIGLLATSLAGIGGFTLVIIAGWLGGYSETHTLIAGLLIALFVGLNVSQLVEFNGR